MWNFQRHSIKFIIFLLCAAKVNNDVIFGIDGFSDPKQMKLLLKKIDSIGARLSKIEAKQQSQLSETSRIKQVLDTGYTQINASIDDGFNMFIEANQYLVIELADLIFRQKYALLAALNERIKISLEQTVVTYSSCGEAVKYNGHSGVYSIRVEGPKFSTLRAYCLEDPKNGEAWMLFQRRQSNSTPILDFRRKWDEYREGFGDLNGNHWLGLKYIFSVTNSSRHELWFRSLHPNDLDYNDYYPDFSIADESKNFAIKELGAKKRGVFNCTNASFKTIDRGDVASLEESGGGGFWSSCGINVNGQMVVNGKLETTVAYENVPAVYLHLAMRPKI